MASETLPDLSPSSAPIHETSHGEASQTLDGKPIEASLPEAEIEPPTTADNQNEVVAPEAFQEEPPTSEIILEEDRPVMTTGVDVAEVHEETLPTPATSDPRIADLEAALAASQELIGKQAAQLGTLGEEIQRLTTAAQTQAPEAVQVGDTPVESVESLSSQFVEPLKVIIELLRPVLAAKQTRNHDLTLLDSQARLKVGQLERELAEVQKQLGVAITQFLTRLRDAGGQDEEVRLFDEQKLADRPLALRLETLAEEVAQGQALVESYSMERTQLDEDCHTLRLMLADMQTCVTAANDHDLLMAILNRSGESWFAVAWPDHVRFLEAGPRRFSPSSPPPPDEEPDDGFVEGYYSDHELAERAGEEADERRVGKRRKRLTAQEFTAIHQEPEKVETLRQPPMAKEPDLVVLGPSSGQEDLNREDAPASEEETVAAEPVVAPSKPPSSSAKKTPTTKVVKARSGDKKPRKKVDKPSPTAPVRRPLNETGLPENLLSLKRRFTKLTPRVTKLKRNHSALIGNARVQRGGSSFASSQEFEDRCTAANLTFWTVVVIAYNFGFGEKAIDELKEFYRAAGLEIKSSPRACLDGLAEVASTESGRLSVKFFRDSDLHADLEKVDKRWRQAVAEGLAEERQASR